MSTLGHQTRTSYMDTGQYLALCVGAKMAVERNEMVVKFHTIRSSGASDHGISETRSLRLVFSHNNAI